MKEKCKGMSINGFKLWEDGNRQRLFSYPKSQAISMLDGSVPSGIFDDEHPISTDVRKIE